MLNETEHLTKKLLKSGVLFIDKKPGCPLSELVFTDYRQKEVVSDDAPKKRRSACRLRGRTREGESDT
jgi:hypothetical protein